MLPGLIIGFALVVLLMIVIEPLVTGALTFAISDRYLGRETSIRSCYRRVLRSHVFLRLLGATALRYLLMLVAPAIAVTIGVVFAFFVLADSGFNALAVMLVAVLILLALGSIVVVAYLMLRLLLLEPMIVLENAGVWDAIKRSWQLLDGNVGKAFAPMLVAVVVVMVVSWIVTGPTQFVMAMKTGAGQTPGQGLVMMNAILSTAVQTLLLPVTSIVTILLYYDLRIRKEGFDLEMLAADLDARSRKPEPGGYSQLPQENSPAQQPESPSGEEP